MTLFIALVIFSKASTYKHKPPKRFFQTPYRLHYTEAAAAAAATTTTTTTTIIIIITATQILRKEMIEARAPNSFIKLTQNIKKIDLKDCKYNNNHIHTSIASYTNVYIIYSVYYTLTP